jgi:uncharacterized protein (DUF1330 family)
MSAYMVFIRGEMVDEKEFAIYAKEVPATLAGHSAKVLALYGAHEELEGDANQGTVILEFPSRAEAKAWYNGEAYRKVREHRFKAAKYQVTLLEGK